MALVPRNSRFSLVHSYDLRKVRSKKPTQILDSEFGNQGPGSVPTTLVKMDVEVQRVSVYSEAGENGKSIYSIVLELDPELDPSNRSRRTETVRGLALDVEEKDLPTLTRLSGRRLEILTERRIDHLNFEKMAEVLRALELENSELRKKCRILADQLQYARESTREFL